MESSTVLSCKELDCFRFVVLTLLFCVTGMACMIQTVRIMRNTDRHFSYQLIVLYVAILECLLSVLHFMFFSSAALVLITIFLKEIELCIITYFFLYSALLQLHRKKWLRGLMAVFVTVASFLTLILLVGIYINSKSASCKGFVIASLFLIAGILVTSRLNKTKISKNIKNQRMLILWALIFVYFITSATSALWDLFDMIYYYVENTCFSDETWMQTFVLIAERVLDLLLPIWATIFVFGIETRRANSGQFVDLSSQYLRANSSSNLLEISTESQDSLHPQQLHGFACSYQEGSINGGFSPFRDGDSRESLDVDEKISQ